MDEREHPDSDIALSPLINLGTQHDGKEYSDLDEKSLTTFCSLNEEGERSDGDHLHEIMRLTNYSKNDAPDRVVSKG